MIFLLAQLPQEELKTTEVLFLLKMQLNKNTVVLSL